jgi:hypothetical protein
MISLADGSVRECQEAWIDIVTPIPDTPGKRTNARYITFYTF